LRKPLELAEPGVSIDGRLSLDVLAGGRWGGLKARLAGGSEVGHGIQDNINGPVGISLEGMPLTGALYH
jgi:hypothetical protein